MLGGIKKKNDSSGDNESSRSAAGDSAVDLEGDTPEITASKSVVRQGFSRSDIEGTHRLTRMST